MIEHSVGHKEHEVLLGLKVSWDPLALQVPEARQGNGETWEAWDLVEKALKVAKVKRVPLVFVVPQVFLDMMDL